MDEKSIHRVFQLSVVLKGFHAALECLGGLLLAVVSTDSIRSWVNALTQEELVGDMRDSIAVHLQSWVQGFSPASQHFYAFYLLSHGMVKVLLVAALLRNKAWAYPASIGVLGLFIVYQLYRFSYTHSVGLIALTLFDLLVLALIWHEYTLMRRHHLGR